MTLRLATAVAILAVVVACGGVKTTHDYDRDADFSQYKTYAWHEGTSSDIQDSDPLNHERLVSAIDAQMQQHGFPPTRTSTSPITVRTKNRRR